MPGHPKSDGLWRVHPGQRESGKCVRELDVTVREVSRTPNAAGLVGLLSHAVGTVTNALREIVAARDEVLLCGVGLAIIGGIIWLLLLRLFASLAVWGVLITTAVALLAASALCALRGGVVDEDMLTSAAAHAADAPCAPRR